jgi:predicted DNA-binding ribbon-helix-helix protein
MTKEPPEAMHKRSVVVANHRTSVSLENLYWDGFCDAAAARRVSINDLVTEIDRDRSTNLSSAIRLFVLADARANASFTEGS